MNASETIRYRDTRSATEFDSAVSNDDEQWRPLAMAMSCFLAAAFVVSWLFEPGRSYWDQFDLAIFRTLNGTLEWGRVWQSIWAVANWRPCDLVIGVVLLMILIAAAHWRFAGRPVRAFVSLAIFALVTLIVAELTSEVIVDNVLEYHRGSPTRVLDDTIRLSSLVDWVESKDTSRWSFPGDHGFVLLMCALYVSYLGNRRLFVAVWLVAILGALPRLISGAHWSTDIIVGSGTMALLTTAFLLATPLHDYLVSLIPVGLEARIVKVTKNKPPAIAVEQDSPPVPHSTTDVVGSQFDQTQVTRRAG